MKIIRFFSIVIILLLFSCSNDKVPAYKVKTGGELAPVKLPPVSEKILENGLKLIMIEHHELPVVSFRLMVKCGSTCDPQNLAGLASFTATLLTKGTIKRSATDIAEEIDFVGGDLNSYASWDASYVYCNVLKKHFDTGLELFADVILNPVFQKAEIERYRKHHISSYLQDMDDPSNLVDKCFQEYLFSTNHPFGFPASGTEKTLKNIQQSDIVDFYEHHYRPNASIVVVSGDIVPDAVSEALEARFGAWEQKEIIEPQLKYPEAPKGFRILLVNKRDATQAQIMMGHFGIERANPDYFPIILMNYILGGGGFSSRLMKTVRADKGLTYGIKSGFDARKNTGPFDIATFTKNETVGAALEEIIQQMKLIRVQEVKSEELLDAQSYITGSFPLKFETPDQMAGQLLNVELYNLGKDYIETYRDKVQEVTIKQVQQAAEKYLNPENMVIVVVGKKDEVFQQLTKFGPVEVKELNEEI